MKKFIIIFASLFIIQSAHPNRTMPTITLSSSVFSNEQRLPTLCTAQGKNVSPQLSWSGISRSVKSVAIICEDLDAPSGSWTHWVIFNLPPTVTSLDQGMPTTAKLPNGALQGKNDFGTIGYGGPTPPKVSGAHRYVFKIYALNIKPNLPAGTTTKKKLVAAMKNHILAQGEIMGTYSRD